jgi:hypothetical protein
MSTKADFRTKLIEDAGFRKSFAADPVGALKSLGMTVPDGVSIQPIPLAELEGRVTKLKAALGNDLTDLLGATRDPKRKQQLEEIMNFSFTKSGELADADLGAVAGGSISAYASVDW